MITFFRHGILMSWVLAQSPSILKLRRRFGEIDRCTNILYSFGLCFLSVAAENSWRAVLMVIMMLAVSSIGPFLVGLKSLKVDEGGGRLQLKAQHSLYFRVATDATMSHTEITIRS